MNNNVKWINVTSNDVIMTPLKYLLQKNTLKVGPFGSQLSGADIISEESDYWVYNQRNVIDKDFKNGNSFITEDKFQALKGFQVTKDDILITTRGTIGKIHRVESNFNKGVIHPCIIKFKIDESKIDYKFLEIIFNESDLIDRQLKYKSNATTIEVIYSETLKNIYIPLLPLSKQKQISQFLYKKCEKINSICNNIEKQIKKLIELKKSMIYEAVTKGLKNDIKLINSNINWLGEIPESWDIKKGKYCLKYIQKGVKEDDEVVTCFRDGQVTLRSNRRLDGFTISEKEIGYQGIDKGDLVVHGMDGFAGAIGISDSRGKASPVLNVLETKHNKRYIMYYLRNMAYNGVFIALSTGIRVRTCDTNWTKLKELPFLLPSLSEQNEIANYLDNKCEKIDSLIEKRKKQIEKLIELKKSLIYEYVTGRKEVIE